MGRISQRFSTMTNCRRGNWDKGKNGGANREDVERATIEWVSHLCRPTRGRPVRGQIDGPAIVKFRMRLRPLD